MILNASKEGLNTTKLSGQTQGGIAREILVSGCGHDELKI